MVLITKLLHYTKHLGFDLFRLKGEAGRAGWSGTVR